jgi:hypothetical protein
MSKQWTQKYPSFADSLSGRPLKNSAEFPVDIEALWSCVTRHFDAQPMPHQRVLLLGFDGMGLMQLHDLLAQLNVTICTGTASLHMLTVDRAQLRHVDVVVLNLDAFGDVDHAVETLRRFRARIPEMAIVLISSEVRADDFGPERAPICDVTLRAPASLLRLKEALHLATTPPLSDAQV